MASCLQVENLTKRFGDKCLFEKISFGIADSQKVAIIAKNGAGKTTLLSILSGEEDYQEGNIAFRQGLKVGYLKQSPEFSPEMTVIESCFSSKNEITQLIKKYEQLIEYINKDSAKLEEYEKVLERMDELKVWDYETKIKQILGKLNIHDYDQLMGNLSGGQRKRIALANVLISEPELLILDEPTNHLDLTMVEWLEDFIKGSKMALLLVTHDRYFLNNVCSDIMEIDQHSLFKYKGNYSYYLQKRQERIDNFNSETEHANNIYRRELEWMRRQPQARGGKAKYRKDAFNEIEARAKQKIIEKQANIDVKATYIGSKIFEAKYISKTFGEKIILKNFYYNFGRYEKLGIVGKNGSGKSTFIKMLIGEIKPDNGTIDIGETVKFGYFSQEGLKFNPEQKVIDVVRDIAEEIQLGDKKLNASQLLQMFLFSPSAQYDYIKKLSGGEKRRLYLCTVLISNPNFLVLDEPTNDLDISTLNILEEYLTGFRGCVIVVSHDRFFMDKVVDHILVFEGDGKIKDYPGNYTDYRKWKEIKESEETVTKKQNNTNSLKKEQNKVNKTIKMTYKEKIEFDALEKEITQLETEKINIEQKLNGIETDFEKITGLSKRMEEVIKLIDEKSIRWLELSEIGK